ncbi:hypothetical protein CTAYLR_009009 [Chrysophaeum taylorii]|uniref:isoleucine--tRNA ligase n=1 Tax=Chrysophaeum taylorii TaxID=2483200 RepID=A0AAD7XMA5_9STRA|nr:hypothetical protein CTAYLR_009009 [Chrysophaeum taylorii]
MEEEDEATMNFPVSEEKTLDYWASLDAFKTSLKLSEGRPEYTFYDGPPFATGLPHYGHILAGTIKDTVTRYAHQTGHHVSRRFGWDCHGLPVEYEIDKTLSINSRDEVLAMGIGTYNGHCRGIVQRYTAEWETVVTRLGRWIDFRNDYRTMDASFMESVWWVFKSLYEKNLVYRGFRVMPYSTACSTPLSNFEAGLNYKEVTDPAVVASFPLTEDDEVNLVAWTTTPWTLPSNLALCVNADLEYVKVRSVADGKVYVVLEERLVQLFPILASKKFKKGREADVYERVGPKFKGAALVGKTYEPLFDFFDTDERRKTCFRVVADSYVTAAAGTGIVHQAPAFGEDDYRVCVGNKIIDPSDVPCPVDADGRFTDEITDDELRGVHVKAADPTIIAKLKDKGRLAARENHVHSYPFCWRSDTPLIYRAVPSWFVAVESLKERLLRNNSMTYWVPAAVKEKRFHNWLADARDWNISRDRFWGTPIPLWMSDDCEEIVVVGSVEELLERCVDGTTKKHVDELPDLHREFVDALVIPSENKPGTYLRRVDAVFDCWFESGSMPYAQLHYPFENSQNFLEATFPADFIAEGLDQTRGWFYTLMVLSTALFDKPAFKNLVVNGLVLAADGKKMSKRLKNYPDPMVILKDHGADALRLYLINSPVVKAETLRFTQDGVRGVLREVMLPWYNAYRFFNQQATRWERATASSSSAAFERDETLAATSTNLMDKWIVANLHDLINFVHDEMRAYRLYTVVPRLVGFLSDLTNWYVRLNRSRLKGGEGDAQTSLAVLFEVLLKMASVMAPFTPFFAEYLYQRLRPRLPGFRDKANRAADEIGAADSIHYVMLPPRFEAAVSSADETVLVGMRMLQRAVELGRRAREEAKISMKTPVKSVIVVSTDDSSLRALRELEPYLLSELNAWAVDLTTDVDRWCALSALPNLPVLGKRLGKRAKKAAEVVKALDSRALRSFLAAAAAASNGKDTLGISPTLTLDLQDGGDPVAVTLVELIIKSSFADDGGLYAGQNSADGSLTVAIETTQDDALRAQGITRELINRVNKLRKKARLTIGAPVDVFFVDLDAECPLPTAGALASNSALLKKANIVPLPHAERRPLHSPDIASDVAPTAFGAQSLRVVLCRPTPALADEAKRRAVAERGDKAAEALEGIVAALPNGQDVVAGTLDGQPFELRYGTDFFRSATEKALAAAAAANVG